MSDRVKARLGVRAQRLVKRFTRQAGRTGYFSHATGSGQNAQRVHQLGGIIVFKHHAQIQGNVLISFEVLGQIELRQISHVDFFCSWVIPSKRG